MNKTKEEIRAKFVSTAKELNIDLKNIDKDKLNTSIDFAADVDFPNDVIFDLYIKKGLTAYNNSKNKKK